MADFKAALEEGIEAYEEVQRAQSELREVLDDFAQQVSNGTGQIIVVNRVSRRMRVKKPIETLLEHPAFLSAESAVNLGSMAKTIIPEPEWRTYLAIVASSVGKLSEEEELCRYELSQAVYPVTLRYANEREECYDKDSLIAGLIRMLKHPSTGGKIRRLRAIRQRSTTPGTSAPEKPAAQAASASSTKLDESQGVADSEISEPPAQPEIAVEAQGAAPAETAGSPGKPDKSTGDRVEVPAETTGSSAECEKSAGAQEAAPAEAAGSSSPSEKPDNN